MKPQNARNSRMSARADVPTRQGSGLAIATREFTCTSTLVNGEDAPGVHYPSAIACGPTTSAKGKDGGAEFDLLVVDASNRLYLIDKLGVCRKTIGEPGTAPGCFLNAKGLAVSEDGQFVYVADTGNDRIQRFRIHDSLLMAIAGGKPRLGMTPKSCGLQSLDGGAMLPKRYALESLAQPHGLALHGDKLFVADTWNHRVVVLNTALTTNFAGLGRATSEEVPVIPEMQALSYWGSKGCGPPDRDGRPFFQFPKGIAVAPGEDGEVVVADTRNHRLQLFTQDGRYTRGLSGGVGDSTTRASPGRMSGTELFSFPSDVCVSASGHHIFVSDQRAIIVLRFAELQPICTLARASPSRAFIARRATQSSAALCVHPATASDAKRFTAEHNRKMEPHSLALYVAEYDEHSLRELVLSSADLRSPKEPAKRNVLERPAHVPVRVIGGR